MTPKEQKLADLKQPTRRTVESLLRDLCNGWNIVDVDRDLKRDLRNELKELEERILARNKQYQALKKKSDAAEKRYYDKARFSQAEGGRISAIYRAEGLTDRVKKELIKLVEKLFR